MKREEKNKTVRKEKIRLAVIILISIFVIITGAFFTWDAFNRGDIMGLVLGVIIAITILIFAVIVYKRGNRDLKEGFPLKDERSKRVLEKASSMAFYVTLYLLLAIGLLSNDLIQFRDVSQATSVAVGCMALLFLIFWIYFNRKGV
jgi:uncharacterized membrane protein